MVQLFSSVDLRVIVAALATFALGACGFPETEATDEALHGSPEGAALGSEAAVRRHLADGEEQRLSVRELIEHGRALFVANWTTAEGQGRPLSNGEGEPLADPSSPLTFPRDLNRVSGPDTASCSHCHNTPLVGGGGDVAMGVFVLGERFDFVTFERDDHVIKRGTLDERGQPATLQSVGNFRKVVGMSGSGFVEMLSRQMTSELRAQAAACARGATCALSSKGVSFGSLTHRPDGTWETSQVFGLPAPSLASSGTAAPSLIIRPFSQAGAAVSLRDFTNGAFNRHQGMQSEERFGHDVDADGDGVTNELTRADLTAVSMFEATLPVPGRVIPSDPTAAAAVAQGEALFGSSGCATCHVPALPLDDHGWIYSEPNPFNPAGDLRPSDGVAPVSVNLMQRSLPGPHLKAEHGVVMVPAYTDLRLHDITSGLPSCASNPQLIASGGCDGGAEPLDQNAVRNSPAFFAGNHKFITRKLWGIANQHTFGPQGQFTTMRDAILAHRGEASSSQRAFQSLAAGQQAALVEFLKSLQILPAGTSCRVVDDHGACLEPADGGGEDGDAGDDREVAFGLPNIAVSAFLPRHAQAIGDESSGFAHLQDGQEFTMAPAALAEAGRQLFGARFDSNEGTGRPHTNGADVPLHDPNSPLAFPHFINRISGPVSSSCTGCHNTPLIGGGGDIIGSVFILGNRFDFVTFDPADLIPLRGSLDERGIPATLQTVSNNRRSVGMSGSGYIEMLARQMTLELQAEAAVCAPGTACPLSSKGVSFGTLIHNADGTWNTSRVTGLGAPSITGVGISPGGDASVSSSGPPPPSLIIRPFFSAGVVNSLRVFSLNSLSRLQGVQAEERFGAGVDADQDGVVNEVTRADVTALAVFQATMAVPGRVIPRNQAIRAAIARGERLFGTVGCASCHIPALPLDKQGWIYSEPNPFNPAGSLRVSDGVPSLFVDLSDDTLPGPRLQPRNGAVMVPAYTDLKLHDMTTGLPSCASNPQLIATHQCDGNVEPLDQQAPTGTPAFFAGNRRFITRKLWGIANQEARFSHHGAFTTMREAVVQGHFGEALPSKLAFEALGSSDQNAIIEFLKSLQVLPNGTPCSIVDDRGDCLPEDWASHLDK